MAVGITIGGRFYAGTTAAEIKAAVDADEGRAVDVTIDGDGVLVVEARTIDFNVSIDRAHRLPAPSGPNRCRYCTCERREDELVGGECIDLERCMRAEGARVRAQGLGPTTWPRDRDTRLARGVE